MMNQPITANPSSTSEIITFLPQDLILNILRRLPLRSLSKCATLSRAWRDKLVPLVPYLCYQTPEFALITCPSAHSSDYHLILLPEGNCHELLKQYHCKPNMVFSDACNGFFLLGFGALTKYCFNVPDHFVVNPITSKSVVLPSLTDNLEPFKFSMLAFDPRVSPHYKVIMYFGTGDSRTVGGKLFQEIYVFSSKTGKWNSLELGLHAPPDVMVGTLPTERTLTVNGYAYRLGLSATASRIHYVMSFHVEEERFDCISCPLSSMEVHQLLTILRWRQPELGVSGGCLQYTQYEGRNVRIWRLEDHNSRQWTCRHMISMDEVLDRPPAIRSCTIASHGQDEVLYFVGHGCYLFRYNLKDRKRRVIGRAVMSPVPDNGLARNSLPTLIPFLLCLNDPGYFRRMGAADTMWP